MGRPGGFPGGIGPRGPGAGNGRGPGRPQWQGGREAMAFGNRRRNPRLQYNAMAMFNLNDSVWDARTYSVTGAAVDKPNYWSARGSVILGGPLRIPKLVSADRQIMFMLNYQFGKSRTGTVSEPVNMPGALERIGDFSQTLVGGVPVTIYDPSTNAPFPGNRIPTSRLNTTSLRLLDYFPDPNLPFAARNYQTSWTGDNDSHNLNARIMNVRLGSKDRLNGSLGYQNSGSTIPNLFEFIDTGSGRGINTTLGWSRNITTRVTNNVQLAFSRMRQQATPYFANRQDVAGDLGIEGTSNNPMNWGPPSLLFTNYANLTDGNFSLNRNQSTSIGDTLLWARGTHNLSFGANYRRFQINQLADTNGRGTWTFNGVATSLRMDGLTQSGSGYDLADFLLGLPTTSAIRYGNPDKYFRSSGYDLFMNDDWRIHSRFTLNIGLRWDYATPVRELYDRLVNLSIDPAFTAIAPVVPGSTDPVFGQLPSGLISPDRNNFSPRLGFAWRPTAARSMVVRGGYGVYYNTSVYNVIAANMAQQPPFAQVLNVSSVAGRPLFMDTGFLLPATTSPTSTFAIDPYYRVGYVQTWTVSAQHDLPLGMFGTIGYLGTKGTRLDQQFLPNTVAPGAVPSTLPQGFAYQTSNGNSIYHAAQFQLNRRFRSGLGWNASYQWSKSIDNAGTGGRGQGATPIAQDWLNYSAERGLSSFDSRHNLSVQAQYSTGMGRTGGTLLHGWKGALAKDWTISSMITLRSGNPFTATVGGSRSQVSGTAVNNTVRADATGLPIDVAGMLFNTAAFREPVPGQWGNAGRNTIPGPTTFFLNGGVGRVIRLGERRSLDIQMQSQNVLNRVVITNWGTVIGANNYGLAASAAQMRRLTLNVRFRF
jgi:trimeric autotransporter adhesin